MVINQIPHFSPTLFQEYLRITNFKGNFQHVYIRARHNLTRKWTVFPFLVTEDNITKLVLQWPTNQLLPLDIIEGITGTSAKGAAGTSKAVQKEKKIVTINLEKNTMQELEGEHDEDNHTEEQDQGTKDPVED